MMTTGGDWVDVGFKVLVEDLARPSRRKYSEYSGNSRRLLFGPRVNEPTIGNNRRKKKSENCKVFCDIFNKIDQMVVSLAIDRFLSINIKLSASPSTMRTYPLASTGSLNLMLTAVVPLLIKSNTFD